MLLTQPLYKLSAEQKFLISCLLVNAGNYLYNLFLGRILGPAAFADAAILITFLLIFSFAAMTFQLATAKFSALYDLATFKKFMPFMMRSAVVIGMLFSISIIVFAEKLQETLQTGSSLMFTIFGASIPVYFIVSVNRGRLQGQKDFTALSITYQTEMISRLLITFACLYLLPIPSATIIAIGIASSLFFGLFPFPKFEKIFKSTFKRILNKTFNKTFNKTETLSASQTKHVNRFLLLTAFYELTQIIINNSDILLVKHFFDGHQAGLYASLALIGRVVYFVAWMFVMLLLPKVVEKRKQGLPTKPILVTYAGYIAVLAFGIIAGCMLFPQHIITSMFGSEYLTMAPLLWKYALATSLFAVANIFTYYFLSLDNYIPVILSGLLGFAQIGCLILWHASLNQIVLVQIAVMAVLLLVQFLFFLLSEEKDIFKQPAKITSNLQ